MPLDPATLCARTAAGDAELAAPRHGLALAQRRLLSLLDAPVGIDELAGRPGVVAERLERDLSRLAECRLIEVHAPTARVTAGRADAAGAAGAADSPSRRSPTVPPGPTPAAPAAGPSSFTPPGWTSTPRPIGASDAPAGPGAPVVVGRKVRRGRALVVGFGTLAAVIAIVWLFAERDVRDPPAAAPAPAARSASGVGPRTRSPPGPPESPSAILPGTVGAMRQPMAATSVPPSPGTVSAPRSAGRSSEAEARDKAFAAPRTDAVALGAPIPSPGSRPGAPAPPESEPRPEVSATLVLSPPPAPESPLTTRGAASTDGERPLVAAAERNDAGPAAPAAQLAALERRAERPALPPRTRESPPFPREALSAGITRGDVRARVSIDAAGRVTGVEILASRPHRVFDRTVSRALSRWTYEPGAPGRTSEVEIAFRHE
ncbi:Protein TonB [Rhizobiaceae bacterium]|nr:Protein TonB [Rhizobiaceae bacterium]